MKKYELIYNFFLILLNKYVREFFDAIYFIEQIINQILAVHYRYK